jgi:hypothetical protein
MEGKRADDLLFEQSLQSRQHQDHHTNCAVSTEEVAALVIDNG